MTLEQVRRERATMEEAIYAAIRKFEEHTELSVDAIELRKTSPIGEKLRTKVVFAEARVQL